MQFLGKVRKKVRVPLHEAERVAQKVQDLLGQSATLFVVGSVRRKRPEVSDLEFVVLPKSMDEVDAILTKNGFSGGAKRRIYRSRIDGLPVELYVAHKPAELGSMLLMYTGDATFNIALRSKLKRMGYRLNQYGIWKGDKLEFQSADEREFFDFVGIPWHWPEDRSFGRRQELQKMVSRLLQEDLEPGTARYMERAATALKSVVPLSRTHEETVEKLYESRFGKKAASLKGASLGAEELIELGIHYGDRDDDGHQDGNGTLDIPFDDEDGLWQMFYQQATGKAGDVMGLAVYIVGDQIQIWAEVVEDGEQVYYVVYTGAFTAEMMGRSADDFLADFVLWGLEKPEQNWLGPFAGLAEFE